MAILKAKKVTVWTGCVTLVIQIKAAEAQVYFLIYYETIPECKCNFGDCYGSTHRQARQEEAGRASLHPAWK